jgi:hypothetical protein
MVNKEGTAADRLTVNEIINQLPDMLKIPCNTFIDEVEKEVFLIGALGLISGILPNYKAHYDGHWIESNLYVYILSGYGGGKGGLKFARELLKPIHERKKEQRKELVSIYNREIEIYKRDLAQFQKGKLLEPPTKPTPAPNLMLFIPINNSKSGVYQLMEENEGRGIMYETEGDTLADAIKQDYGNYSDTLRKTFHHEPLELFRRQNSELIEIEKPFLSVVLSSTPDQLKTLIPSTENGLYSRFLYYFLKQETKFNDVFEDHKKQYSDSISLYAGKYFDLYSYFENLTSPQYFQLKSEQKTEFIKYFDHRKQNIISGISQTMAGTANRYGIIAFRLMMILTALRQFDTGKLTGTIYCNDADFQTSINLIDRLEEHSISVFELLGNKPDKYQLAMDMRKNENSLRTIEKATGINHGTLSRYFKKLNM